MSHFSMLVITDNKPSEHMLVKILEPFMEFECTGEVTDYVISVDKTEDALREYAENQAGDEPHSSLDAFIKDWYGSSMECLLDGEEPDYHDVHKWGYYTVNEDGTLKQLIQRTNPNAYVDWWQVGGRWQGFLIPKPMVEAEAIGRPGEPGLMGSNSGRQGVDMIRKDALDLEGMRRHEADIFAERWDKIREIVTPEAVAAFKTWEQVRDEMFTQEQRDQAREFYHSQEARKQIDAYWDTIKHDKVTNEKLGWLRWGDFDQYLSVTREKIIEQSRMQALATYGFIKDGQWVSRGEMGWWGMSSGEVNPEEWYSRFNEMIDNLPETAWLTLIDCHI